MTHEQLVDVVATLGRLVQVLINSQTRTNGFDDKERASLILLMRDLHEQLKESGQ